MDLAYQSLDRDVDHTADAELRVGFLLTPRFTFLPFAGFVDALRLAADEGDRSRPIRCSWHVMTADGRSIRASNAIEIVPTSGLVDPARFDYLVVAGGTLHGAPDNDERIASYLRGAAQAGVPLVGICTGSFILARAGLLEGRRCCVSWFHHADFIAEFPAIKVDADSLYVMDRDRITCAGGTSAVHLASHLIDLHLGAGQADKGLRIMIEDKVRRGGAAQPPPSVGQNALVHDPRVRRALLILERNLAKPPSIPGLAARVGTTPRHLTRLFREAVGTSPAAFAARLRLDQAHRLITSSSQSMARIAFECGYSDAAHLSRQFRNAFGQSPTAARLKARARSIQMV